MATAPLPVAAPPNDGEDLTDEQIQQMLAEATVRMKARTALKAQNADLEQKERPRREFPKLNPGKLPEPYLIDDGKRMRVNPKSREARALQKTVDDRLDKLLDDRPKIHPALPNKYAPREKTKVDAGSDWYNLPKTDLTPELKRDLQLLHMRNVLDPHRHYKKEGGKMQAPEYSQIGTIIEGPTEFYSGRVENKNRKRTFVEEVLAGEQETGRFKKKYGEVQDKKTSGKKAFYKALKAKRKSGSTK